MSKGLRLTEKWMQRALWLVAFAFAAFLIGLGGKIVANLWDVEQPLSLEQFMDPAQVAALRAEQEAAEGRRDAAQLLLEQTRHKHEVAQSNTRSARETFDNWLATRRATARPDQDPELLNRTRALDALEAEERAALAAVEGQQQVLLDASQALERAQARWKRLEEPAYTAWVKASTAKELRVFLYWPAGCSPTSARGNTGPSCGASSSSRCSPSSSSWCPTCPATAATCATSSASW